MKNKPRQYLIRVLSILGFVGAVYLIAVGRLPSRLPAQLSAKTAKVFDAATELQKIKNEAKGKGIFLTLDYNAKQVFLDYGLDNSIVLIHQGFLNNEFNINQCHTLMHLLGHNAYSSGKYKLSQLASVDSQLCGGAFQHGVEAEITIKNLDYITELKEFCAEVQKRTPGADCYHGMGHATMHRSLQINNSLKDCDRLLPGPVNNLTECYKGVFSETAFLVQGVDGDTGLAFPNGPPIKLAENNPLDLCVSLEAKYQKGCSLQLSRIIYDSSGTPDASFKKCLNSAYPVSLQEGCVQILGAVDSQHTLTENQAVKIPQIIFTLPAASRHAYMQGFFGEARAFVSSGKAVDVKAFCRSFKDEQDQAYCSAIQV